MAAVVHDDRHPRLRPDRPIQRHGSRVDLPDTRGIGRVGTPTHRPSGENLRQQQAPLGVCGELNLSPGGEIVHEQSRGQPSAEQKAFAVQRPVRRTVALSAERRRQAVSPVSTTSMCRVPASLRENVTLEPSGLIEASSAPACVS